MLQFILLTPHYTMMIMTMATIAMDEEHEEMEDPGANAQVTAAST